MLNKLNSFPKLSYVFWRRLSPFITDVNYQEIRKTFLWLILLITQVVLDVIILSILYNKIPVFFQNHQKRLALEQKVIQTKNNVAKLKLSAKNVETIIQSLPGSKDNYNLLERVNSFAAERQLSLLNVNFLPIEKSKIPGLLEQAVEVRLEGSFVNIFNFLDQLKNEPRPTLSENLTVSTRENNLSNGSVQAEVLLRTYLTEAN